MRKEKDILVFTCDRCKKKTDIENNPPIYTSSRDLIPSGWKKTDAGDLCHDCYKKYLKLINEWRDGGPR